MNYHKLAIKLAKTVKGKYRVAAIVLDKRDRVISYGVNSYEKTHPIQAKFSKMVGLEEKVYLHAEIQALVRAKKQGYKIYICRIDVDGNTVMAKPCDICSMAIKDAGIKIIEHTV